MSESRCLDAADTLGARLCRDAVWSEGRCNWLADSMEFIESRWQVTHRAFGPELYNGTSGIALFLAYLFACTQERIFRKTAEGAIKYALSQADRLDPDIAFGFYAGLTGIAYALLEAGEIFGEEAFLKRGLGMLEKASIGEPGSELGHRVWQRRAYSCASQRACTLSEASSFRRSLAPWRLRAAGSAAERGRLVVEDDI